MGTLRSALGVLVATVVSLGGACGDDAPADPAPVERESSATPSPAGDETTPPPTPWPADVRSLRESAEGFESVEACAAGMREAVPLELGELLADLGYEDALGEACRALEAAKLGDPERCDSLVSSAVQRSCRIRVATLHGLPAACPPAVGADGGRDPLCLAWASRDAGLCDGAAIHLVPRCRAVATNDAARCRASAERSRGACEAMVARLGSIVDADDPPEREEPELTLRAQLSDDHELTLDDARSLTRGVAATADGCAWRVSLSVDPPLRERGTHPGVTLDLPLGVEEPTLGPESEVRIGTVGTGYAIRGTVAYAESELRLGGAIAGQYEGQITRDGQDRELSGSFRTFLRDLEPLPETCPPRE